MLAKNGKKIDTKSPKTYQKKCLLIQLSSRQMHAISKVVSKNKTNSFILFRSWLDIIQKVLFFVP